MTSQVNLLSIYKNRRISNEPNWSEGNLGKETGKKMIIKEDTPIQQSDTLKPFYMKVVNDGLHQAYEDYKGKPDPFAPPEMSLYTSVPPPQTGKPRKVIIVGAGMAGLAAAYELRRAGHTVQILELQERVGGRVKTFGEKEGFAKGLYVDGKYFGKGTIWWEVLRPVKFTPSIKP
jgi:hypothetical protein